MVPPAPSFGSTHDDELLVRLAGEIMHGRWLGNYETFGHLTLAKPPGYSMFLAYTHWLPWSPIFTTHVMLLIGALLVLHEFRALGISRGMLTAQYLVVALFGQWFGDPMSRVYRESLLTGLTFLIIGLSLNLGRRLRAIGTGEQRYRGQVIGIVIVAMVVGLSISAYRVTKPGWYPLALLLVFIFGQAVTFWARKERKQNLVILAAAVLITAAGSTAFTTYAARMNENYYGVSGIDTFSEGPFADVLSEWASVHQETPRQYVVIDVNQRTAVYEVSPTALKLKPYLEYSWGNGWRSQSCMHMKICDESVTWFPWELRDAVEKAGLGGSAKQFENTLATIASDIRRACNSGKLRCGFRGLVPGVQPLDRLQKREFIDAMSIAFTYLTFPSDIATQRGPWPDATPEQVRTWKSVVKGIPRIDYANEYRPSARYFGSTMQLLDRVQKTLWFFILFFGAMGLLVPLKTSNDQLRTRRRLGIVLLVSLFAFAAQLALLEVSSGMYLSTASSLYMLPAFPFLMCAVFLGLSRLEAGFIGRFSKDSAS